MAVLIYTCLGPLFAFLALNLGLKLQGEPDLFYQGGAYLALLVLYSGGVLPALILARVFDFLGLHARRQSPGSALAVLALLCAGAGLAYAVQYLPSYMMIVPPVALCWMLTRLFAGTPVR